MNVICIEEKAFYELLDRVFSYFQSKGAAKENKWIFQEEAMRLLNIKSKTTLQRLRNDGKIRFSQPQKK
ncbi:DNA-binding protein [Chryseolinea sp. H1M3-3]|uniref:DNA-binding protein n=1 Tax=Chryseolinea sp. H1M3-3 TaxID=3034144 RepID=UPI0023EC8B73|nr:DNA-binding protein [Chryseolinea sp. H1M3-3]